MAAIVVCVMFVLAGHKVTIQWTGGTGNNVTVVDFHADVVISDC